MINKMNNNDNNHNNNNNNHNIRFSKRIMKIKPSATIATADKARELERSGISVVRMETGEPHLPTPDNIKNAAIKALNDNKVFYSHSRGVLELRQAICDRLNLEHGIHLNPDKNIIITPGGKQAILYALLSLVDEDDEVIIPTPAWNSYFEMTVIAGGNPIEAPCDRKKGFGINIEEIKSKLSPKTKAIIINSPNNPTGNIISKQDLQALLDLCNDNNIVLIADEIYDHIVFDKNRFFSIMELDKEFRNTILINGFSKTYSMTGWRLGYAVAGEKIIAAMTKMQQHSATHPATFTQYAAIEALRGSDDFMRKANEEYQGNKDFMVKEMKGMKKFSMIEPLGGFYGFINIEKTGKNSADFCLDLLDKSYIATVPGSAFGKNGEGYIRICLATERKNLIKLVECLRKEYEKT
jgi:aspartate aminotransferase